MSDINDVAVSCSIGTDCCDEPTDWKREAELQRSRADDLMDCCDRFHNENEVLKRLFVREYNDNHMHETMLKEDRQMAAKLESKMYALRTIFNEHIDEMRIPKDLRAEILDLLRF